MAALLLKPQVILQGTVFVFSFILVNSFDRNSHISTECGDFKGTAETQNGKMIYKFLGIPYAEPPVGNFRFSRPNPKVCDKSQMTIARRYRASCFQSSLGKKNPPKLQSEDCLFLNIFIPFSLDTNKPKAVMVYFNDGDYLVGNAEEYDPTTLAIQGGVIVVTFNSRLGVFGFLSVNSVSGNYGLFDQELVLEWLQSHIGGFGGDPNRITLFGNSKSLSLHLFSNRTMHSTAPALPRKIQLFHRVILQSHSALAQNTIVRDPSTTANKLLDATDCKLNLSQDMLACLRKYDAESLQNIANKIWEDSSKEQMVFEPQWGPVVDGMFLNMDPQTAMSVTDHDKPNIYNTLSQIDVLAGLTRGDSSDIISMLLSPDSPPGQDITNGISKSQFENWIAQSIVDAYYTKNKENVKNAIIKLYGSEKDDEKSQAMKVSELFRDMFFLGPILELLNAHDKAVQQLVHERFEVNKTALTNQTYAYEVQTDEWRHLTSSAYFYFLAHAPQKHVNSIYGNPPSWFGDIPFHGDELPYVFGVPLIDKSYSAEEKGISEAIMKAWTSFAKYESPNTFGEVLPWPQYRSGSQNYLRIEKQGQSKIGSRLFDTQAKFWLEHIRSPGAINIGESKPNKANKSQMWSVVVLFMCCCFSNYF